MSATETGSIKDSSSQYNFNSDAYGFLTAKEEKNLNKTMLKIEKSQGSQQARASLAGIIAALNKDSGDYAAMYSFLHSLKAHVTDFSAQVQSLINGQSGDLKAAFESNPACSNAFSSVQNYESLYASDLSGWNDPVGQIRKACREQAPIDYAHLTYWKGQLADAENNIATTVSNGVEPTRVALQGEQERYQSNVSLTESLEKTFVNIGKLMDNKVASNK